MPEVPLSTTQAWLWKWDDVLPLAKRAGELITLERGVTAACWRLPILG
jgi:gentisate 1,2-dioxygenase